MVNAWIEDNVRVVTGCDASYLNAPFRHMQISSLQQTASRSVEWLCVDFSPSGAMNPPYTVIMSQGGSQDVGRLQGHGEDSLGLFRISEATLNRSLQWMSGTCLDDDDHANSTSSTSATLEPPPLSSATPGEKSKGCGGVISPSKRVVSDTQSDMLKAAGRSTPKELPQIMAKYRDSMASDDTIAKLSGAASKAPRKIAFGEMVDRVAGFQYRYQSQLTAGKLLDVCAGAEHMELLKTYQNGHGDDHVRLLAFGDERGLWGMWERGRYQFQHKMDSCTRGAFRMWQL